MFLLSFENLIYFDHINHITQFLPPTYPPNFMFSLSLSPSLPFSPRSQFLSLKSAEFSFCWLTALGVGACSGGGWFIRGPTIKENWLTLPLLEAIRFQQRLSLDGTSCTPPGWILSGVSLHRSCTCCQNLWVHMCNCPALSRKSFLEDTTASGSYSFCPLPWRSSDLEGRGIIWTCHLAPKTQISYSVCSPASTLFWDAHWWTRLTGQWAPGIICMSLPTLGLTGDCLHS